MKQKGIPTQSKMETLSQKVEMSRCRQPVRVVRDLQRKMGNMSKGTQVVLGLF